MMTQQKDLERSYINRAVSINSIFQLVCPELWRDQRTDYSVKCPFHGDTKPSLRIYVTRNMARCYGSCNRAFDPIALWAIAKSVNSDQAKRDIISSFDIDLQAYQRMVRLMGTTTTEREDPIALYNAADPDAPAMFDYLTRYRGLSEEVIRRYGLRFKDNYVIFPHYKDGIITSCSGRATLQSLEAHLSWPGPLQEAPFGWDLADKSKPVFVCEAALDTLSLAMFNLNTISVRLASLTRSVLAELSCFPLVITATDGDKRGRSGAKQLEERLSTRVMHLETADHDDMNKMLTHGRLEEFLRLEINRLQLI
jgi:DNA primase